MQVQAFIPERPVERLDIGIIRHDVAGARFPTRSACLGLNDPGHGAPGARKCGQAVALT